MNQKITGFTFFNSCNKPFSQTLITETSSNLHKQVCLLIIEPNSMSGAHNMSYKKSKTDIMR